MGDGDYIEEMLHTSMKMFNAYQIIKASVIMKAVKALCNNIQKEGYKYNENRMDITAWASG